LRTGEMDGNIDDFFFSDVGPVWGELRGGLWHSTASHRFRGILSAGEIHPAPSLPPTEFLWAHEGTTYCRSIGAVSLFDFAQADWAWLLDESISKAMPRNCWGQFLRAPREPTPPDTWTATVWLAVDRSRLTNFMHWKEVEADWRAGSLARKWMPCIEACHKGPLPLSACTHIIVVCAVNSKEFCRMPLHSFDLGELDRIEADWRKRFSESYASRALPMHERERAWLDGLKNFREAKGSDPQLEKRLQEARRRLEEFRSKPRTDPEPE
jgi:hypothetical protein